ncbi:MAG: IS21 family transposase [Ruminobacter sp.]|nr:IS21 family transposase [Ruminobacter sp.]
MRIDITQIVKVCVMNGIKPNYSKIARQYNCDPRTVKRYYLNQQQTKRKPRTVTKVLDSFEATVINKIDCGANAYAIYNFIKNKGYKGGYTTVKNFCFKYRKEKQHQVSMRFETSPGFQAQVDWKEKFKLTNKSGEIIEFNVFIVVLGYSRMKYLMVTKDRTQTTVFNGLLESFKYFNGVPRQLLFDNMRTIVDRSRTQFNKPYYNEKLYSFSKDAGFMPKSCLAYKPQTKGKVEAVAKLINRLKVYNNEFDTFSDLDLIVRNFNDEINREVSASTGKSPIERFKEEQKYLNPLPNLDIFEEYLNLKPNKRKVTSESMINVDGKKYSVPPQYINLDVFFQINNNNIIIFDEYHVEICRHHISRKKFNYRLEDYKQIVSQTINNKELITNICNRNLSIYDQIGD